MTYRFTEGEKILLRKEVKGFLPELPETATEIDFHERAYLLGYGTDERNKFGSLENLQRRIAHNTTDEGCHFGDGVIRPDERDLKENIL